MGALQLRKIDFQQVNRLAQFNCIGKLVELSVIGGFGVLSLSQGIFGSGNLYFCIVIAFVAISSIFFKFNEKLYENELTEAREAVGTG